MTKLTEKEATQLKSSLPKYRHGDKVRVTDAHHLPQCHGTTGHVTGINAGTFWSTGQYDGYNYRLDVYTALATIYESALELVEEE